MGMRTNLFRRMHRKIVVIDDTTAFVGGINYSAEHMSDYGPEAKQDYAVQVEKGRWCSTSCSSSWKTCPTAKPPAAGGDVVATSRR